jgi:hypothetical protein
VICIFDSCRRPIVGSDVPRRIEWHEVDGELRVFGDGMLAGVLSQASGPLVQAMHYKCYFASQKRERIRAARAEEATVNPSVADWRDQETAGVEEFYGVDGPHRGAGTASA